MIKFQKVSLPEVKKLIQISYEGDVDLMQKYHVTPNMQYWDCVDRTMEMISEVAKERPLIHYKVIYQKQPIGYVSVFDKFLYSFGININYRKKHVLVSWWGNVEGLFKEEFYTMLFQNNTRTIGFLLKNKMKILECNNKNNSVTLIRKFNNN